jgi:hypothetical protein
VQSRGILPVNGRGNPPLGQVGGTNRKVVFSYQDNLAASGNFQGSIEAGDAAADNQNTGLFPGQYLEVKIEQIPRERVLYYIQD